MEETNKTMEIVDEFVEQEFYNETEQEGVCEDLPQEEVQAVGFWQDDRGVGVIEIVLILVILIGLVLIFKEQITAIVNNAFASITGDAGRIIN